MIRSELVQLLVDENPGLSAREVEKIVSVFFDEIVSRLTEDGRVELRGFGASSRARKCGFASTSEPIFPFTTHDEAGTA